MTQYWIEVPVENAKEVVQRKVDELSNNGGIIVSYDQNCEVVLYRNEWDNWSNDRTAVWFGTFFVTTDVPTLTNINISLIGGSGGTFFDWYNNGPNAGEYPCVMFNDLDTPSQLINNAYFVGYKFTLTYP